MEGGDATDVERLVVVCEGVWGVCLCCLSYRKLWVQLKVHSLFDKSFHDGGCDGNKKCWRCSSITDLMVHEKTLGQ